MLSSLFSLLFPSRPHSETVIPDFSALRPIHLFQSDLQAQGIMYLDGLTAGAAYASSKDLQQLIRQFKYGKRRALAVPLGQLLADTLPYFPLDPSTVLCPVPLHWLRRFARGFNQADLLAREVSRITGTALVHDLRRTRPTGHQAWRSHDERRLAMRDAFTVERCGHIGVTLVDDVATTMSTLDACACALKEAGVSHVDALVVALG